MSKIGGDFKNASPIKRHCMNTAIKVQEHFAAALDQLVEKAQEDRYIIAAVLFGSLSYDAVWEKSDIDLFLITTENPRASSKEDFERFFSLVERDINIHAVLQTRSEFKKTIEGSVRGAFMHSAFSRSRLLFTHDETIRELYDGALRLGERDRQVQLFRAGAGLLPALYKAQKFCAVKRDPHYSYLWLTQTYTGLAQIESFLQGEIPDREVLLRACEINPDFFEAIYTDLADKKKTIKNISAALAFIDVYLTDRIPQLFQPLLDYLSEAGTIRSATEIGTWFKNQMNVEGAVMACEWLADKGIISKAAAPVRLTKKSQVEFDELAFYYDEDIFGI
jgi:predicted nucleotidyltransferase